MHEVQILAYLSNLITSGSAQYSHIPPPQTIDVWPVYQALVYLPCQEMYMVQCSRPGASKFCWSGYQLMGDGGAEGMLYREFCTSYQTFYRAT